MEFLAGGFTPYVKTGLPPHIGGLRYGDPIHAQRVAKFHIFSLRTLLDNWIESGREGMYENVRKRHLPQPIMAALMHWSSKRSPELSFQWWDGSPSLYIQVGGTATRNVPFETRGTAILLFARLLDSPYRYRIAKCRFQGCTYYYTDRVPRGPLKYGTFCPAHRQKASAIRAEFGAARLPVPRFEAYCGLSDAQFWNPNRQGCENCGLEPCHNGSNGGAVRSVFAELIEGSS